mmetsp:Transcript_17520/g.50473  ORF Transcript_17520/g.50473 Transcript_17520/m.50473 type:complete len:322 (-) Transcript_17520:673-1638(-)
MVALDELFRVVVLVVLVRALVTAAFLAVVVVGYDCTNQCANREEADELQQARPPSHVAQTRVQERRRRLRRRRAGALVPEDERSFVSLGRVRPYPIRLAQLVSLRRLPRQRRRQRLPLLQRLLHRLLPRLLRRRSRRSLGQDCAPQLFRWPRLVLRSPRGRSHRHRSDWGCRRHSWPHRLPIVDVQTPHGPIRLCERPRVLLHESLTSTRELGALHWRPERAPQVAAQCQVEDEAHILEVLWSADLVAQAEVGKRFPPTLRVRPALQHVLGDLAPRPKPRADVLGVRIPLCGPDATTVPVVVRTHGVRRALLRATLVGPLA